RNRGQGCSRNMRNPRRRRRHHEQHSSPEPARNACRVPRELVEFYSPRNPDYFFSRSMSPPRQRYHVAIDRYGCHFSPNATSSSPRMRSPPLSLPAFTCNPRSSIGYTFSRQSTKIRNISAVQRPMPLSSTSASITSSSLI